MRKKKLFLRDFVYFFFIILNLFFPNYLLTWYHLKKKTVKVGNHMRSHARVICLGSLVISSRLKSQDLMKVIWLSNPYRDLPSHWLVRLGLCRLPLSGVLQRS